MTTPTQGQVHVDTALTNISVAFMQNASNFVAGRVFPNVPVSFQSDRYYTYDRGDFNRDEAEKRAPGTESSGSSYAIDNTPSYYCDVYSHHKDIPDQVRSNADAALSPNMEATNFVMQKMMLRKEIDWATSYFTSGVWTTDITGAASSPGTGEVLQWNDASSDPITDIRSAQTAVLESTGFEANTFVMSRKVFDALVDHPDIVDRVKYSGGVGNGNPARVNEQTLAALLGIDRVMVSKAINNTAAKGDTNSHSFIMGKNALLTHAATSPGLMTPTGGYTFSWTGHLGTGNQFGAAIKRFRLERIEADRIEAQMAFTHKLVAADLGYFWDGIVA